MKDYLSDTAVQNRARSLIRTYGGEAASIAQLQVDQSLKVGDTDTALTMDQVRREVVFMLAH